MTATSKGRQRVLQLGYFRAIDIGTMIQHLAYAAVQIGPDTLLCSAKSTKGISMIFVS